jgi:hypothetical protein
LPNRPPAPDPGELLSRFRATYRNYSALRQAPDALPEGAVVASPTEQPLGEEQLPDALRDLLETYRREHPKERVTLLKYIRFVNGTPETIVEDESGLPPDDELITLSQTVTLNTRDVVEVVTDLFVGRRT